MNLSVIKIKYFDLALQNATNRKNIQQKLADEC